jgi:hypothetical protein
MCMVSLKRTSVRLPSPDDGSVRLLLESGGLRLDPSSSEAYVICGTGRCHCYHTMATWKSVTFLFAYAI